MSLGQVFQILLEYPIFQFYSTTMLYSEYLLYYIKKKLMQRTWKEPVGARNSIEAEDLNFSF